MKKRNTQRATAIVEKILENIQNSTLNDMHPEAVQMLLDYRADMIQDAEHVLEFD